MKRASPEELQQTAILADFYLDKPDDRVEYDMFYTSSNDRALDFLDDFTQTDLKLNDKVLFTPRLVLWRCKHCDEEFAEKNCVCGGRYCAMDVN